NFIILALHGKELGVLTNTLTLALNQSVSKENITKTIPSNTPST
ncbi:MAG: hypothetical protein K0R02_685, partial [Rickettsiaceae bacterium]|nr:hypothetical protein [Rickettsiaceae bacterium]